MRRPGRNLGAGCVAAVVLVLALASCSAKPPDRHHQVDELTQQVRGMPGVVSAGNEFADSFNPGLIFFRLNVELADDITGDQLAAITSRYLENLRAVEYSGYRTELDARRGWNLFAVDSGNRTITDGDQVMQQARSWVALRHDFPAATITFHAAITHPTGPPPSPNGGPASLIPPLDVGHPGAAAIDLADDSDYTAVTRTVATLTAKFSELNSGDWTVRAGKQHPADIRTSRRLPNTAEIEVWNKLNADQSIPHVDAMTINGRLTGPIWVSEKTESRERDVALQLAAARLPIVATLPAPVLYSANDQLQGHFNDRGLATGPVAVTVGGCTPRTYPPAPAEQALINSFEKCRR